MRFSLGNYLDGRPRPAELIAELRAGAGGGAVSLVGLLVLAGGGVDDPREALSEASLCARLYSVQHVWHRHSRPMPPSAVFVRVSLQPCCALMSV
jgi:hypothetical protein